MTKDTTEPSVPQRPKKINRRAKRDFALTLAPGKVTPTRPAKSRPAKPIITLKPEPAIAEVVAPPPSPFAKHQGVLRLGTTDIDCYVLDTGYRVLSLRASVHALSGSLQSGDLEGYINVAALRPYLDAGVVMESLIEFNVPGLPNKPKGLTAERFLEICKAYVTALAARSQMTERQKEIAVTCSILMSACAKVGLIALIDEATGYQYERAEDALQVKLKAFIAEELRDWEKTFPNELWEQFGRLTRWQGSLHSRPKWWGKLVLELIYEALDPDIAKHLRETKPPPRHGENYHQWMTRDVGLKALLGHIYEIIGIAKTCRDMTELRYKVSLHYGKEPMQLTIYVPQTPATVI